MRALEWKYLLKLLSLIVMMDGKVYQEEMAAFVAAALKLQTRLSPEIVLTEQMIRDWFINHRDDLKEIVDSLDYDQVITSIISPIRGLPEKELVLKAMMTIAQSDGFYHAKERLIIIKTARYWNIRIEDLDG